MPKGLKQFNASNNELSGVVPENLSKFPSSSFYPGNDPLHFPNGPSGSTNDPDESSNRKHVSFIVKVIITVSIVIAVLFMHPIVVGLRGYKWGPTQHEKLILSDYSSLGSLASFLYGVLVRLYLMRRKVFIYKLGKDVLHKVEAQHVLMLHWCKKWMIQLLERECMRPSNSDA
ncbi:hypothetical protein VNO80_11245 [Phaseolus coccineus]|uniref:Uncharacterized protein n=1 Tax=Phaseolus coccineus TaxID=3886 RepID=A0AAN9N9R8_PHACN